MIKETSHDSFARYDSIPSFSACEHRPDRSQCVGVLVRVDAGCGATGDVHLELGVGAGPLLGGGRTGWLAAQMMKSYQTK